MKPTLTGGQAGQDQIEFADVADEAQVRAAAAAVDARWGRVDALISNAGCMPPVAGVLDLELSVLRQVLDSNLIGCFLTTKHFAPIMIRGGAAGSSI